MILIGTRTSALTNGHIHKSTGEKSICPVCRYEDKSGGVGVLSCMSVDHVLTGMAVLHFHVPFHSIIKLKHPVSFFAAESHKIVCSGKPYCLLAAVHDIHMFNSQCFCYRLLQHPADEQINGVLF